MRRGIAATCAVLLGIAAACSGLGGLATGDDAGGGCPAGFGDCDGNPENGCETRLDDNASHCGACAHLCPTPANGAPACALGKCGASCNAGFADCNGNTGDGCEQPVANDPENCGACAHDCSGAECREGLCRPQLIAGNQGAVISLAISPTRVVYTGSTGNSLSEEIRVVDKAGGPIRVVVTQINNIGNVEFLAADDSHVYFDGNQRMVRCALDAPQPCNVLLRVESYGRQSGMFRAVEIQGGLAYDSTDEAYDAGVFYSALHVVPKDAGVLDAGTFAGRTIQSGIPGALSALAVDSNELFYGSAARTTPVPKSGTVYRFTQDAGSIYFDHGDLPAGVRAISFDADLVAWALGSLTSAEVYTCPRAACTTPEKIASLSNRVTGIAVAGPWVYVAVYGTMTLSYDDGAILRFPRTGNATPVVLATQQRGVVGLEQDATHLYWGNRFTGDVYRIAK